MLLTYMLHLIVHVFFAVAMVLRAHLGTFGLAGLPLVGMATSPNLPYVDDPQLVELAGSMFIAKFFQYVINFAFTAAGTLNATQTIDSDADFQLIFLQGSYDQSNATVLVTEGGAGGLAWSNQPVNIANFLGTAQLPFPIGLIPQLLPKKRVYQFQIVNSFAGTNNIQICFTGYKLFPAQMAAQVGAAPSNS